MFRLLRIAVLLLILIIVGISTLTDSIYSTRWNAPLVVALFPINGDGRPATAEYIASLTQADFQPLEEFFRTESAEYGVSLERPVWITLAPELRALPPTPPRGGNMLQVMYWSLRFRAWSWWVPEKPPGPTPRIKMFLTYHDPNATSTLEHSTALRKGLIGMAQLFALDRAAGSNATVIAHELLHTLGATDKYDPNTGLPAAPHGFAEPDRQPLYPQRFAELMGGRIPISAAQAEVPGSLRQVMVGPATAAEIGWAKQ
jgi:hypothetical protein